MKIKVTVVYVKSVIGIYLLQKLGANILCTIPTKLGYEGSKISDYFMLINGPLNL